MQEKKAALRWLSSVLVLSSISNFSFAADEWEQISGTKEQAVYMSAQRMKAVKLKSYESGKPTKIEAWDKSIITYDSIKDGRTVGDYTVALYEYDCTDETSKLITATNYKSNGDVQGSSYTPSYRQASRVLPNSIGETQLKIVCQVLDKMNNGEEVSTLLSKGTEFQEQSDPLDSDSLEKGFAILAATALSENKQDAEQAIVWLKNAANNGVAVAQFYLGLVYDNGGDASQYDPAQAVFFFRKAAEQGYAPAQNALGKMYEKGDGVNRNNNEAFRWYKKAAEQGFSMAQHNLAISYLLGEGIEQSDRKAFEWFTSAAKQGEVGAQFALGLAYEKGRGVAHSNAYAIKWYEKVIKSDNKEVAALARKQLNNLLRQQKSNSPKPTYQTKTTQPSVIVPAPAKTRKLVRPNSHL